MRWMSMKMARSALVTNKISDSVFSLIFIRFFTYIHALDTYSVITFIYIEYVWLTYISDEFKSYVDEKPEYLPVIKEHMKIKTNDFEDNIGSMCVALLMCAFWVT